MSLLEQIFLDVSKLNRPNVLLPRCSRGAVSVLLEYFEPISIVCMTTDRQEIMSIEAGCYKMPADFLMPGGRLSLIRNSFDLVYLPGLEQSYWYISYDYVIGGGYMAGTCPEPDERFTRWLQSGDSQTKNELIVIRK